MNDMTFQQRASARGTQPSIEQRLALIETSLAKVLPALTELSAAVEQHQFVIEKLIETPVHVAEAMKALAEDQSKVNLALRLKLDMQAGLITELQEIVEGMREETDVDFLLEDDEDDDTTVAEDNILFDIETNGFDLGSPDTTVHGIGIMDEDGPRFLEFTGDIDADEQALRDFIQKLVAEQEEEALSGIRVNGDYYAIPLRKRPEPGDIEAMKAYDDYLSELVDDAEDEELIDADTAAILIGMIRGSATAEDVASLKPADIPNLDQCLVEWGEVNENGTVNIHIDYDVSAGVVKTIAYAAALSTMEQVLYVLHQAVTEE